MSIGDKIKREITEIEHRNEITAEQKISRITHIACVTCASVAIQPIPFADIFVLTPIQAYFASRIAAIHGVSLSDSDAYDWVKQIIGIIGMGVIAQQIAIGFWKTIFFGISGMLTIPLVYGLTYSLMKVANVYFSAKAKNGKLSDSKIKNIWKNAFREENKKGSNKANYINENNYGVDIKSLKYSPNCDPFSGPKIMCKKEPTQVFCNDSKKQLHVTPVKKVKAISQFFSALSEGLEEINKTVHVMHQVQLAIADFNLAIKSEERYLNALVEMVDSDAKFEKDIETKSADYKRLYDDAYAEFSNLFDDRQPLSEIFIWKEVIKPKIVNDEEIQLRVDYEYECGMQDRNQRLAKLKARCANDLYFRKNFVQKMIEAKYPYISSIV